MVVARRSAFGQRPIRLLRCFTGFVMENSDGSREFINVNSIPIGEVDRATVSRVERGLHTLLAEGRLAEIYVRLCGASGRVETLDAVQ
jgi:hypothetical protein